MPDKPQSVRFWTDDGFEVVLADDYDALVEQLEAARTEIGHLRDELVGADMWLERKTIHQEKQADKIAALEEQNEAQREALDALRWGPEQDCWCSVKYTEGGPNWHTKECLRVRELLGVSNPAKRDADA